MNMKKIEVKFIKQKLVGLFLLILSLVTAPIFIIEEIALITLVMLLGGLWLLSTKERMFDKDYIFIFDVEKFRGLR